MVFVRVCFGDGIEFAYEEYVMAFDESVTRAEIDRYFYGLATDIANEYKDIDDAYDDLNCNVVGYEWDFCDKDGNVIPSEV